MIVVNMDLLSAISATRNARLGTIEISNCGDHPKPTTHGNYRYAVKGKKGQTLRAGMIINWPRQAQPPLALLHAVLNDAYPKRSVCVTPKALTI